MLVEVAIFMYKKKKNNYSEKKIITNLKINTTDAFCQ